MSVARSSGRGTDLSSDALHPVAAKGFAKTVEAYRRSRPSYPPEAVVWLVEALGIGPGRTVVEVGAGTGKFTALVAAAGANVVAVEPLETMRAVLAEEVPSVAIVDGTAESLGLAAGSADAIVAGAGIPLVRPRAGLARVPSRAPAGGSAGRDLERPPHQRPMGGRVQRNHRHRAARPLRL